MFSSDPESMQWLVDISRDLHRHPEISHKEKRTTEKIIKILKELEIEVHEFPDRTGAVGMIKGSGGGPTLGLRADIDALPIQKLNDISYRSQNEGTMHACGHDANTAIMIGVAKKIVRSGLISISNP